MGLSTLKSQGIRAFTWHFLGKLGAQGIAFIVSIFLARLLEPSEFGLVAMVSVIIGMAQIFTDIGLSGSLIQRQKVLPVHYSSVFYFNICVATTLSLLTFFSSHLIADFYDNQQLVQLAQVMSISFMVTALSSVQSAKLRKELRFALLTKIRIFSGVFSGIVGITLALLGAGVWSLVVMSLSSGMSYNLAIWIFSGWSPSIIFSFKALKQLWGFGSRIFIAVVLDTFISRFDFLLIGKLYAPETLGFFQRAKGLNSIVVNYTSGTLIPILFPTLSKMQNDLEQFQSVVVKLFGVVNFAVFFILGSLFLVADNLIVVLFTEKWLPSSEYLKILVLSGFEIPIGAVLITVLSGRGNSKSFLRLEIYKKGLFLVNLLLIYFVGIIGYLYGLIFVALLSFCLNVIFASREINLPIMGFIKPFIVQAVISSTAVVCVVLLMQQVTLPSLATLTLQFSLFMLFYFFLSIVFRTASYRYSYNLFAPVIMARFTRRN